MPLCSVALFYCTIHFIILKCLLCMCAQQPFLRDSKFGYNFFSLYCTSFNVYLQYILNTLPKGWMAPTHHRKWVAAYFGAITLPQDFGAITGDFRVHRTRGGVCCLLLKPTQQVSISVLIILPPQPGSCSASAGRRSEACPLAAGHRCAASSEHRAPGGDEGGVERSGGEVNITPPLAAGHRCAASSEPRAPGRVEG